MLQINRIYSAAEIEVPSFDGEKTSPAPNSNKKQSRGPQRQNSAVKRAAAKSKVRRALESMSPSNKNKKKAGNGRRGGNNGVGTDEENSNRDRSASSRGRNRQSASGLEGAAKDIISKSAAARLKKGSVSCSGRVGGGKGAGLRA